MDLAHCEQLLDHYFHVICDLLVRRTELKTTADSLQTVSQPNTLVVHTDPLIDRPDVVLAVGDGAQYVARHVVNMLISVAHNGWKACYNYKAPTVEIRHHRHPLKKKDGEPDPYAALRTELPDPGIDASSKEDTGGKGEADSDVEEEEGFDEGGEDEGEEGSGGEAAASTSKKRNRIG